MFCFSTPPHFSFATLEIQLAIPENKNVKPENRIAKPENKIANTKINQKTSCASDASDAQI
jgi:hypothetical protein